MLTHDRLVRLCRARDRLCGTDPSALSIAEIAQHAAMSRFYFIRQFKALFGETPHQCRIRARLERAKHLLAVGDNSVTDVCMAVGFSSLGSFSTLFTRRFGETPSSYRARLAGSPNRLVPDCLSLLRARWEGQAQFSSSDRAAF